MRRPSAGIMGALWSGLAVSGSIPLELWHWVLILCATVILVVSVRRRRTSFALFLACIAVLGCMRSPEARWNLGPGPESNPGNDRFPCIARVRGRLLLGGCGEPVKVRAESVLVGYAWLEGRYVYLRGSGVRTALSDGMTTALGAFHAPRPRLNPFAWDAAARYRRQGIMGTLVASDFIEPEAAGTSFLTRVRERIQNLVDVAGSGTSRGVLEALLLGQRANLTAGVEDAMIRAGTYHVIAISGLHVGIVVLLVTSLATALGPPRALRIALAVLCVLGYVVFTGSRPSAERAGTLFFIVSLVKLLQWKVDMPNCVCAAGFILLLAFPHLAWDVGFRLSLAAVFGITLLVPALYSPAGPAGTISARVRQYVVLGVLASFSAQVVTLPIMLYHFGRVSLMGILSNLLILPLVTLAVAGGLEASVFVLISERLGLVFMKGASLLVTLVVTVNSLLTRWIDPVIHSGRPEIWRLITYALAVGYIGLVKSRLKRRWKFVSLILLYVFLAFPPFTGSNSTLTLTFIHVGDGDACLLEFPHGTTVLIDAGAGGDYDAGRQHVLPLLAMKGLKRVHTVVISHAHNDHYGGLTSLLGNIDIGRVLVGSLSGEDGYVGLLEECRKRGINLYQVKRGDTLTWEDGLVEVLHPSIGYLGAGSGDPNAQSVVLRVVYGGMSFLFTGDLTPGVQRELVNLGLDLSCDVLKVPHHGAPGGVDPAFAEACGAKCGIISVGSRFPSHPSPETVDLLEASGIRTLVTLRHGAATVRSDGTGLEVRAEILGRVWPDPERSWLDDNVSN